MQALLAVMLAGRVGILRSARLLQHMEAEAVAMGKGQLQPLLVDAVGVSGQKGQHQTQQAHTEVVAVETGLHQTV